MDFDILHFNRAKSRCSYKRMKMKSLRCHTLYTPEMMKTMATTAICRRCKKNRSKFIIFKVSARNRTENHNKCAKRLKQPRKKRAQFRNRGARLSVCLLPFERYLEQCVCARLGKYNGARSQQMRSKWKTKQQQQKKSEARNKINNRLEKYGRINGDYYMLIHTPSSITYQLSSH